MGTNTLPDRTNGQTIDQTFFNILKSIIKGDWIPRDNDGVIGNIEGSLGTSSQAWLKAFIESGYNFEGQITWMHTFNGLLPIRQGWMRANGVICNEANYEAQHSVGDWDIYIGSSNMDGLNLPNLMARYPFGVANTTQDGTTPITGVGNGDSEIDFQHNHSHSHTNSSHNHKYYVAQASASADQTYDTNGNLISVPLGAVKVGSGDNHILASANNTQPLSDSWTENQVTTTDTDATNALSATQDIRPASLELIPLVRIVP